jgi:hypothetical protein
VTTSATTPKCGLVRASVMARSTMPVVTADGPTGTQPPRVAGAANVPLRHTFEDWMKTVESRSVPTDRRA